MMREVNDMNTKTAAFDPHFAQFFENLNRNLIELRKGQLPIYRGKLSALKREAETLKLSEGEDAPRFKAVNEKIGGLKQLVRQIERNVNLGEKLLKHPPRREGWMLFGEVLDPKTGKGVADVRVELFDRSGEPVFVAGKQVTATTDEMGCFHIDCAEKDCREFLAKKPEMTVKAFDAAGKVIHIQSGIRPVPGGLDFIQVLGGEGSPGRFMGR
jgi:hypothetical protein